MEIENGKLKIENWATLRRRDGVSFFNFQFSIFNSSPGGGLR
jgi:hypothetical protein